jgi:hypothetical protein
MRLRLVFPIAIAVVALSGMVVQGVTRDTKFAVTELRPTPPYSDNAAFYEASLLENGDVLTRDTTTDELFHWVADHSHAPSGQLSPIPWPIEGTFFNQGYLDVSDGGRALLYCQTTSSEQDFLWEPTGGPAGHYTPMSTLVDSSNAWMRSVNDVGQFGGYARPSATDAFRPAIVDFDSQGAAHTTYLSQTIANSFVKELNNAGQATVVRSFPTTSTYSSYLWIPARESQPEVFRALLAPQSSVYTRAMNDMGWIVGDATATNSSNGYLWRPSADYSSLSRTVLFQFGETSQKTRVWDINDDGVAVGAGYGCLVAAIWSESTGDLDLNDMILPEDGRSVRLCQATSINDYGQILATAVIVDPSRPHGYTEYETTVLLTPVPEPAVFLMGAQVIVVCGFVYRWRRSSGRKTRSAGK